MTTHTAPSVERLLTTTEVAELLRCSEYTIQRYAMSGRLPKVQLVKGGIWKFKASDVQALIDRNEGVTT